MSDIRLASRVGQHLHLKEHHWPVIALRLTVVRLLSMDKIASIWATYIEECVTAPDSDSSPSQC